MVKSKHDGSPPKVGGEVYYAQGRYVMPGQNMSGKATDPHILFAEHPHYFDSKSEVYEDVARKRNWPPESTERYVDVCRQSYWWDAEGKMSLGAAELLEAVAFDPPLELA